MKGTQYVPADITWHHLKRLLIEALVNFARHDFEAGILPAELMDASRGGD